MRQAKISPSDQEAAAAVLLDELLEHFRLQSEISRISSCTATHQYK